MIVIIRIKKVYSESIYKRTHKMSRAFIFQVPFSQ